MSTEVTSDKILDKNIITSFSAILKLQWILGSFRIEIRDGVVGSPNKWHNLYTSLLVLLATFSESCYLTYYCYTFYHQSKLMFYLCFIGSALGYVSYVLGLIISRFTNRDLNVNIYYSCQKISRILQLSRNTYFTNFHAVVQNRTMMLIYIIFPLCYTLHTLSIGENPFYVCFMVPALLSLYIDNLLCSSLHHYLGVRLNIFNKMLLNFIEKHENNSPKRKSRRTIFQMILSLVYPSLDRVHSTLDCNQWLECVQEIIKCHQMVNVTYKYQILSATASSILWTFTGIAIIVVGLRSGIYPLLATITLGVWPVYYIVSVCVVSILAEWFQYQMKRTKMLCVRVMYYNSDGPYRRAANEVLRTIHYKNPKFDVYGVFELNANLPFIVLGIIATNVLVVIQFVISTDIK